MASTTNSIPTKTSGKYRNSTHTLHHSAALHFAYYGQLTGGLVSAGVPPLARRTEKKGTKTEVLVPFSLLLFVKPFKLQQPMLCSFR